MTDYDREQRQLMFEQTCQLRAVQKCRKDFHKMRYEMSGGYLSGTPSGRAATLDIVQTLAPKFHQYLDDLPKYKSKNSHAIDAQLLCKLMGVEVVLGLVIKAFIDSCGREKELRATKVIGHGASRLKSHWCRLRFQEIDPKALNWIKQRYRHAGTYHKIQATSVLLKKITGVSASDVNAEIPHLVYMHATAFVLECVTQQTGWFTRDLRMVSKHKTVLFLKLSEQFEQFCILSQEHIESQLQQLFPMLSEPRPWDANGENGGYLDPVGRASKLMKLEKGKGSDIAPKQLELINGALQPTAHEVNEVVFQEQNTGFGISGFQLGSFKPISFHPLTNERMPDWMDALPTDHPDRVAWRKEKHLIQNANAESRRNGIRTMRNIQAARQLVIEDKLWIPWSAGHMGRCFVLSAGALSPQGSDAERALLRFADGAPMTERGEYHLKLHVANMFGITESSEAKLKWVDDNHEFIRAVANEPLDNVGRIEVADEPWQFIAACHEVNQCVFTKEATHTHLPVSNDATASGLQILALLARDKQAARHVNLVPGINTKQDVYAALKPLLKQELEDAGRPDLAELYLPRKAYKSNLVSRIYGSVLRSRRQAISAEVLKAHNYQLDVLQHGDAMIIARCMEAAMQRLAPGALALFDNLQALGKHCSKNGKPAEWVTPIGNRVVVNPRKHPTKRVSLGWFGDLRMADDTKEEVLDLNKVKTSTAPLLVHSLDAAILAEAFHDWERPLTTCHDCFATLCVDADDAINSMLKAYVTVLKDGKQFLDSVAHENGMQMHWDIVNTMTDEDVENVLNCQYALC